jgi:hypothetical protein
MLWSYFRGSALMRQSSSQWRQGWSQGGWASNNAQPTFRTSSHTSTRLTLGTSFWSFQAETYLTFILLTLSVSIIQLDRTSLIHNAWICNTKGLPPFLLETTSLRIGNSQFNVFAIFLWQNPRSVIHWAETKRFQACSYDMSWNNCQWTAMPTTSGKQGLWKFAKIHNQG